MSQRQGIRRHPKQWRSGIRIQKVCWFPLYEIPDLLDLEFVGKEC